MIENFYDNIFISDTHLSTKGCNDEDLVKFLHDFYSPTLYLVGDIFDLWKLRTIDSWPRAHTDVMSEFIQTLEDKREVRYIIGNHDEFFENFIGFYSALVLLKDTTVEIGGKKLLVTHGHQFDMKIKYFGWLGVIATGIYDLFRKRGESTFSLSDYLETHPSKINTFEKVTLEYVKKKGLDGIICGHTHKPNMFIKDGLIYANTGDFVSNSTFIAHKDNTLTLIAYENGKAIIASTLKL